MKFPGKRKSKHYFPVTEKGPVSFDAQAIHAPLPQEVYITGIDQLLVDVEVKVDESYLKKMNIVKGQSQVLNDETVTKIYNELKSQGLVIGEFAGGAIGNTLHNYSVLADDRSVLLGTITSHINVGDYAFHYLCNTSARVNLSHLTPCQGPMGRAICFVTPDGERSFAIGRGIMDELPASAIPEELIAKSASLLVTAFLLRNEKAPIYEATLKALEIAKKNSVPVVFSLGTEGLVSAKRDFLVDIIKKYVTILAGNFEEMCTLTQQKDPLLAGNSALDYADMVFLTHGQHGLYIGATVDESQARETRDQIHSKAIAEYNRYEYSRAMLRSDCKKPVKFFSHINPYLGGPSVIKNTNGAGDSALAALLHDVSANTYHKITAPTSPKNQERFLTYSSIHQICKYANRVSYEVLRRNSPRLMQGLPEKEDNLEETYWAK